jgi:hypothetical protein
MNSAEDFLQKWQQAPRELDLAPLEMMLDAAEVVLKKKFPGRKLTADLIIQFSQVIAMQMQRPLQLIAGIVLSFQL